MITILKRRNGKSGPKARLAHIRETPSSAVPCLVSGAYSGITWVPVDSGSPISTSLLPVAHMGLYPGSASLGTCFPPWMPPRVHRQHHVQPIQALHTGNFSPRHLVWPHWFSGTSVHSGVTPAFCIPAEPVPCGDCCQFLPQGLRCTLASIYHSCSIFCVGERSPRQPCSSCVFWSCLCLGTVRFFSFMT